MTEHSLIVSGANGFLGSELINSAIKNNYKHVALCRSTSDLKRFKKLEINPDLFYIDKNNIEQALIENKSSIFIHTATNYGRNNAKPGELIQSNVSSPLEWLSACANYEIKSFINTDTILDKYVSEYAMSKYNFRNWCSYYSRKGLKVINVKIDHMYGVLDDSNKFIMWLLNQFRDEKDIIPLTSGDQYRNFIYMDDVVSAFNTIMKNNDIINSDQCFYDLGRELVKVREFVELLMSTYEEIIGHKIKSYLDFGSLPLRTEEQDTCKLDNSDLMKLGWNPKTSLKDGVKRVVENFVYNYRLS